MAQPPWSTSLHASDDSWYAELERLVQQHEQGEISDEQFNIEKRRILQQSRRGRSQPVQLQIVTAVYESEREARSTFDTLMRTQDDEVGHVVDAALLRRDAAGAVHITEHEDVSPGVGAKRGALIDVLVGLIFPPSLIAGAPKEPAASALISYLTDHGFDDRELRALGVPLQPGQSAIFVIAHGRWSAHLAGHLHSSKSLATYPLPNEILTLVTASVNEHPTTGS